LVFANEPWDADGQHTWEGRAVWGQFLADRAQVMP